METLLFPSLKLPFKLFLEFPQAGNLLNVQMTGAELAGGFPSGPVPAHQDRAERTLVVQAAYAVNSMYILICCTLS
jgi:hypothetical protein